jgi:hypothetical protein
MSGILQLPSLRLLHLDFVNAPGRKVETGHAACLIARYRQGFTPPVGEE